MTPDCPAGTVITFGVMLACAGAIVPPGSRTGNEPVASCGAATPAGTPCVTPGIDAPVPRSCCAWDGPKTLNTACRSPEANWVNPRPSRTSPPNHADMRPARRLEASNASTKYTPPIATSCLSVFTLYGDGDPLACASGVPPLA